MKIHRHMNMRDIAGYWHNRFEMAYDGRRKWRYLAGQYRFESLVNETKVTNAQRETKKWMKEAKINDKAAKRLAIMVHEKDQVAKGFQFWFEDASKLYGDADLKRFIYKMLFLVTLIGFVIMCVIATI